MMPSLGSHELSSGLQLVGECLSHWIHLQAAEKEVEKLRGMFSSRGCKEDLVPDPELLADGKVRLSLQQKTSTT